jgi:hypothetical protein
VPHDAASGLAWFGPNILNVAFDGWLYNVQLVRVAANATTVRVSPPGVGAPPNSIRLHLTVDDVNVEFREALFGVPFGPTMRLTGGGFDVECNAEFQAPVGGPCGDIPVRCDLPMGPPNADNPGGVETPSVQTTGTWTADLGSYAFFNWLPVSAVGVAAGVLDSMLARGVRLHFQQRVNGETVAWPVSSVAVAPEGNLTIAAACPINGPPPIPPVPNPNANPAPVVPTPLRGVLRARSIDGSGYYLGSFQNDPSTRDVIEYRLVPEVRLDWATYSGLVPPVEFLPWKALASDRTVTGFQASASEVSRSLFNWKLPDRMGAEVELVRVVPKMCFVPMKFFGERLERNLEGAKYPYFIEYRSAQGTSFISTDLKMLKSMPFDAIVRPRADADFTKDVVPLLKKFPCQGSGCQYKCDSSPCPSWSRIDLVTAPLPPPPKGMPNPPPENPRYALTVWARAEFEVFVKGLELPDEWCQAPVPCVEGSCSSGEYIVDDIRGSDPAIEFGKFQVDSANFQSEFTQVVDVDATLPRAQGFDVNTQCTKCPSLSSSSLDWAQGKTRTVTLTKDCADHAPGGPHLATPCWSAQFTMPTAGTVRFRQAISGTTVPPTMLSDLSSSNYAGTVTDWGNQVHAVHGTLDRSAIQWFTETPAIYRQLGVTSNYWDYRPILVGDSTVSADGSGGDSLLDWEHTLGAPGAVPSPDQLGHPLPSYAKWDTHNQGVTYFADWKSDRVRSVWAPGPLSHCFSREMLYANPRELGFVGAGLSIEKAVQATAIYDTPAGGFPPEGVVVAPTTTRVGSFSRANFPVP